MAKVNMESLFRAGWGYDFTVVVEGKTYYLHRPILASHSGFFRSLFRFNEDLGRDHREEIFPEGHAVTQRVFDHLVKVWYGYSGPDPEYTCRDGDVVTEFQAACAYLSCDLPEITVCSPSGSLVDDWAVLYYRCIFEGVRLIQVDERRVPIRCYSFPLIDGYLSRMGIDAVNGAIEQSTQGSVRNFLTSLRCISHHTNEVLLCFNEEHTNTISCPPRKSYSFEKELEAFLLKKLGRAPRI